MHAQQVAIGQTDPSAFGFQSWTGLSDSYQQIKVLGGQETVFYEGDESAYVYEVLEGVVCCYRLLSDGRRQVLAFSFPGDLIGLVQSETHGFNAEALKAARIRRIPRNTLLQTAMERPEIGRKLLEFATSELAVMQDRFVMLGRKSALEKVASFLLAMARSHLEKQCEPISFDLPMKRVDIADYLGLTFETVSRAFTKLRRMQAIELPQTQKVVLLDVALLKDLAENESGWN